jgi:uncharacterized protein DUF397
MVWRKSTKSGPWTDNCVEVDILDASVTVGWFKSAHSGDANMGCVEVGKTDAVVAVRDSKDPKGPVLRFDRGEWLAFIAGVKDGEFNL